ncbi:MAG: glycosyltransferase [Planctomycetota bacterium]|nr:glycosyltransferase [Planctomycetota bacterium]
MRVCLVTSELAPFRGWGVGTTTALLARALHDAGHEVHLLVDDMPGLRGGAAREFPGVRTHILTSEEFGQALAQCPAECTRRPIVVHRRLARLHDQFRFDAIEFNDFYGDAYMALQARRLGGAYAGVRMGVVLHSPIGLLRSINAQHSYPLDIAMIAHMEAESIRHADVLLAPSRAIVDALQNLEGFGDAIDPARLAVVHNPMELPGAPCAHDGTGTPEVLFFGRLETRKGPDVLIRAAKILLESGVDLRVRIVGVDTDCGPAGRPMRAHLQSRVVGRAPRERFIFEDNRPRAELFDLVRRAAVCCFPARWDNFPNACLEAMAQGACVVSSDGGGMREVIEDGRSGLLARAGDAPHLAQVLGRALADRALRTRLGEAARERVREVCDPRRAAEGHAAALLAARPALITTPQPVANSGASSAHPRPAERVSVVIPVYNLGATLPETLASVQAQTRRADEVVLVDDGSTDPHTIDVLRGAEAKGCRVVRQENRGLPGARNAGIHAASGDWVVTLDADDLLAPTFIEACLRAAALSPGAALVSTHMACFTESPARPEVLFVPLGLAREIIPAANVASSAMIMVRRDAMLAIGGYDETLHTYEDWEICCRLAGHGYRAEILPEPLIWHRMRPGSLFNSLTPREDFVLRSAVMARHAGLSPSPSRTARIVLGLRETVPSMDAATTAAEVVRSHLRYRLADRADALVRAVGVRSLVKRALLAVEGRG